MLFIRVLGIITDEAHTAAVDPCAGGVDQHQFKVSIAL